MDKKLAELLAERRQERCPDRVLDAIAASLPSERLRQQTWQPRFRFALGGLLVVSLLVLGVRHWAPPPPDSAPVVVQSEVNAQVVNEAYYSLAYIGQALLKAGKSGGQIIVDETFPPLKDGIRNTKETLLNKL